MEGAQLTHAKLQGANLAGAELQGANLFNAHLQGAILRDAQLQGANLSDAQLQGDDLSEAQLQGADLSNSELQGADLSDADAADVDLEGSFVYRTFVGNAHLATTEFASINTGPFFANEFGDDFLQLTQATSDEWIAAAKAFVKGPTALLRERAEAATAARFNRLRTDFRDTSEKPNWLGWAEASLTLDPDSSRHRERLATILGDLACDADGAPYAARGGTRATDASHAQIAVIPVFASQHSKHDLVVIIPFRQ